MTDPLVILGEEQSRLDPTLADGGLPPLPGVRSYCVFRASRDTKPDGLGYTYHHHVDMAAWKGKLYVGWNTCLKDEDLWPSRELLSVSDDGVIWSDPVEMFPQGVSTPLRMYFFLAPNGRMLIIAGLRPDEGETVEDNKHGLVVRELRADHTLGEVFTLQPQGSITLGESRRLNGPMFDTSPDAGFVDACRALLADRVYLEQQDRGTLLGERAMKWHDARHWPGGILPGTKEGEENVKWTYGKAHTFFDRPPSANTAAAIVGISKMGWTTVSTDGGETWSAPVVPKTLITGKAKVFAQNHPDGSITLVYNPSTGQRWPLAIVSSRDGIHFSGMRIVQGELPRQRYEGRFRSIGPQYVRGLSKWSDDGSRSDRDACTWLVYSMNKEDIWVSRVSLPIVADSSRSGSDTPWNVYRPKWSSVDFDGEVVTVNGADPFDHAAITCLTGFRDQPCSVAIELTVHSLPRDQISIEALSEFGSQRLASAVLQPDCTYSIEGEVPHKGTFELGTPFSILFDKVKSHLVTLRTGPFRNIGGKRPVEPGSDLPAEPVSFTVHSLVIS